MSKVFAITPVQSRVTLDAKGQARITFNVANTTPQAIRGRVAAVPLQSTQEAWLSVEGEKERAFSAEQTHQFTVVVSVPAKTPPGDFSLRLDCVATHNPDELFTEGPVVAFEAPPAETPKKPFPWWLVAAAVLLLVVVGGGAWWFFFRTVVVPNVVGEARSAAEEKLRATGLTVAATVFEEVTQSPQDLEAGSVIAFPPQPGIVLRTHPKAGESVERGGEVELTVEGESVIVPPVEGLTTEQAIRRLQGARLGADTFQFSRSSAAQMGIVLKQHPLGDTRFPVGGLVALTIGSGPIRTVHTLEAAVSAGVLTPAAVSALSTVPKGKSLDKELRQLPPPAPNQE